MDRGHAIKSKLFFQLLSYGQKPYSGRFCYFNISLGNGQTLVNTSGLLIVKRVEFGVLCVFFWNKNNRVETIDNLRLMESITQLSDLC